MNVKRKNMTAMVAKIGIVTALSAIMSFPPLGTIPIPIFLVEITLAHLPTIVFAMLEGPFYGAVCGLFLGVISMIRCLMEPVGLKILIANPVVAIVPRILIGVVAGFAYMGFKKLSRKDNVMDAAGLAVSGALGALINTVGVLGLLYMIYAERINQMLVEYEMTQAAGAFLLGIGTTGGVGELIACAILAPVIVKAVRKAGYK